MENFFISEYAIQKDKELSYFSKLPNIELIRSLAEKYKDKINSINEIFYFLQH